MIQLSGWLWGINGSHRTFALKTLWIRTGREKWTNGSVSHNPVVLCEEKLPAGPTPDWRFDNQQLDTCFSLSRLSCRVWICDIWCSRSWFIVCLTFTGQCFYNRLQVLLYHQSICLAFTMPPLLGHAQHFGNHLIMLLSIRWHWEHGKQQHINHELWKQS